MGMKIGIGVGLMYSEPTLSMKGTVNTPSQSNVTNTSALNGTQYKKETTSSTIDKNYWKF